MASEKKIFTEEYFYKFEQPARQILEIAHKAVLNEQSPNFIEIGRIEKLMKMSAALLADMGFIRKSFESIEVYFITDKGEEFYKKWIEENEKDGVQKNLFPSNGC